MESSYRRAFSSSIQLTITRISLSGGVTATVSVEEASRRTSLGGDVVLGAHVRRTGGIERPRNFSGITKLERRPRHERGGLELVCAWVRPPISGSQGQSRHPHLTRFLTRPSRFSPAGPISHGLRGRIDCSLASDASTSGTSRPGSRARRGSRCDSRGRLECHHAAPEYAGRGACAGRGGEPHRRAPARRLRCHASLQARLRVLATHLYRARPLGRVRQRR